MKEDIHHVSADAVKDLATRPFEAGIAQFASWETQKAGGSRAPAGSEI